MIVLPAPAGSTSKRGPVNVGARGRARKPTRTCTLCARAAQAGQWGAEVAAQLLEQAPGVLEAMARIASPDHPIPSSGPLEKELLPGPAQIIRRARELVLAR